MTQDAAIGGAGYGMSSGSGLNSKTNLGEHICPTGGATHSGPLNKGLEQFLGRLGISEEMVNNLRSSMANVDIEEYLDTAREYLKNGTNKATAYAKEHPGQVAAGVAALAVGAGLLISSLKRD